MMINEYIKLMADYQSFPIWKISENCVENMDPEKLPISKELVRRIRNWQIKYDKTLNLEDPINSGFKNESEVTGFDEEGLAIWKKLIQELGPSIQIKYFSRRSQTLFE